MPEATKPTRPAPMPADQRPVPEAVAPPVAVPPAEPARATQPQHRRTRPRGRDGTELAGALGNARWPTQADRADRTRAGPYDVLTLGRPSERAAPRIAPRVEDETPPTKRRRGSDHKPSNGQFGGGDVRTASTSSTATGGSGSASGAGAAGLVALLAFAVVSGAAVRLLIASQHWRSLTLFSLLERPG
jgi:hypothetical protein